MSTVQDLEKKMKTDKWKVRRRIAITSFLVILAVLFFVLFGVVTLDKLSQDLVTYIVGALVLIVLSYQGTATIDDIMKTQTKYKFGSKKEKEEQMKDFEDEGGQG